MKRMLTACVVLVLLGCTGTAQAATPTATEFPTPTANSHPQGIAVGPDGNLWFTEFGANKIGRITPSGTITVLQRDHRQRPAVRHRRRHRREPLLHRVRHRQGRADRPGRDDHRAPDHHRQRAAQGHHR